MHLTCPEHWGLSDGGPDGRGIPFALLAPTPTASGTFIFALYAKALDFQYLFLIGRYMVLHK